MSSKIKTVLLTSLLLAFFILPVTGTYGISISELPSTSSSWTPAELDTLDYFVISPDKRQWWTFVDLGFGELVWQHAGVYSNSDNYGSKQIIHAIKHTAQETPASIFLKYNVNRIIWVHKPGIDSTSRNNALQVLRDNIVDRVYYPAKVDVPFMDPDGISLNNPSEDSRLYCSQLVHTTYDQLLDTDVVGWATRPITPTDLVDDASYSEIKNHYSHSSFSDIQPGFGPIGSTRDGYISDKSDEDWWGVHTFDPNKKYVIETLSNGSNTADTVLYLYRTCFSCSMQWFTKLGVNDDDGEDRLSKIAFSTPTRMSDIWDYYIMVRGYRSSTGGYKVKITEVEVSDSDPDIEFFYNQYPGYFGDKLGSNYSCYFSYTCQNFSNGRKIAVHNQDKSLHYYTSSSWYIWRNNY